MNAGVVCIGGSGGSLPTLETILKALEPPTCVPIVVLVHRLSTEGHGFASALQAWCALPVLEVEDREEIQAGFVYLAPGGYNLMIAEHTFVLSLDPPEHYSVPSIDALFSSAADRYGPGAVAVALSCANTDGAAGAAEVKAGGGVVLAEDPMTTPQASLVRAVAGFADRVLEARDLALVVAELAHGRSGFGAMPESASGDHRESP